MLNGENGIAVTMVFYYQIDGKRNLRKQGLAPFSENTMNHEVDMPEKSMNPDGYNIDRMPPEVKRVLSHQQVNNFMNIHYLAENDIHHGDARQLLRTIKPNSISLSVWSPPYFVGKEYEAHLTFEDWTALLSNVIALHYQIIKPGGFLVINIADILCFKDQTMPKIQADAVNGKRCAVTREHVLQAREKYPGYTRYQLAKLLGCSEQTVDRRLNGNNIRGGKHETQTRIRIVGGMIEEWGLNAGFFPYDRRIWVKDPAWQNSRWASLSYRAIDEFEYLYFFWKPGIIRLDRSRLSENEWKEWGSRAVWTFPSVRINDDHEAKFPLELPLRVIRLLTDPGDTVLDCFMGSGTTAIAALRAKRAFIGIEILKKYVNLARKKIAIAGDTLC